MINTSPAPGMHDFAPAFGSDGAFTTYPGNGGNGTTEAWPRPNGVAGTEGAPEKRVPLAAGVVAAEGAAVMHEVES